jgi:hypothetical protein
MFLDYNNILMTKTYEEFILKFHVFQTKNLLYAKSNIWMSNIVSMLIHIIKTILIVRSKFSVYDMMKNYWLHNLVVPILHGLYLRKYPLETHFQWKPENLNVYHWMPSVRTRFNLNSATVLCR